MQVRLDERQLIELGRGRVSRRRLVKCGLGVFGATAFASLIAACTTDGDGSSPTQPNDDTGDDDDIDARSDEDFAQDDGAASADEEFDEEQFIEDWLAEYELPELPELDPESLRADIEGESQTVTAYENTWVGEVTDDLFIAFSLGDDYPARSGQIAAYACDSGDTVVYLTGDLEDDEAVLDDCVDKIELTIVDDEITGTLTLEDQDPLPFVAEPATGEAGLFAADPIQRGDIEITMRWVVLADGRQRGGRKCRNPWTGDCMWCPQPR